MDALLLSTSAVYGSGYLTYALNAISEFLGPCRRVHFAPYALADHASYTATVRTALTPLGVSVLGLHETDDPRAALASAEVLFVGGGNTFRLLRAVQDLGLLEPVQERVTSGGLRYWGSSAGTNLACPSIRTTNDMPIVEPPLGLGALGLVPFQVNPHYVDPDPGSRHMGETREQRLAQFLEENDVPVLGLREGAWLRQRDDELTLHGTASARLFRRGAEPSEVRPGSDVSDLLATVPRFDATG